MGVSNILQKERKRLMEKEMNIQEPLHRDCAPHDAAHCDINDHHNLSPADDDCGHYVNSGPGVGKPAGGGHPANGVINAGTTPDSARHNHDQDPEHGPGVK
jgi:hypothetical protein